MCVCVCNCFLNSEERELSNRETHLSTGLLRTTFIAERNGLIGPASGRGPAYALT